MTPKSPMQLCRGSIQAGTIQMKTEDAPFPKRESHLRTYPAQNGPCGVGLEATHVLHSLSSPVFLAFVVGGGLVCRLHTGYERL